MTTKCKILVAVSKYLIGINILWSYTCIIFKGIDINKKKKCLPNKEYISGHRWERIDMVVKWMVHIHVTAELKAYWLLVIMLRPLVVLFL